PRAEPEISVDPDGARCVLSVAFARCRGAVAGAGRRPLVRRTQPEGRRLPRRGAVIHAPAGAYREWLSRACHHEPRSALERFRAKWAPVRVKKTRQNKNLEPGSDSIRTEKALRTWA